MSELTPLIDQMSLWIIGAILALPGIYALYKGMHRDLEEQNLHLQVDSMSNEIQRLQILTDEKAREIARLQVEVSNLESIQFALFDNLKRMAMQVEQLGQVPIVDVEKVRRLLPSRK